MSNKDFKTKNSLLAVCSQQDGQDSSDGYHLKTNLPSFNPDQNGVEKVSCKTGANSIIFSLKDKKVVEDVKNGLKGSTQFFSATDKIIDESKLSATFAIMRCDCPYNSEDYDLNINLSKVQLLFNGNFLMNVDFAFEASKEKDRFNILCMLNLGPSIDLVAAADANLEATGLLNLCTSLRQKFGLELVGTLDNSFTFGSCKRRTQPRLESSLGSNTGFFVNENDFSILKFHTLPLLIKCL
ncbi:hypothetical protein RhiirC2_781903 [Rhizophagus irregularis]|uniref:Uncharacterized protein n=1 Tax=Rhizophagus irregularis TaxID=588596 RepID=A0A2N1N4A4_9GLOM|nr:hypothetical protein RhiirC2_781903 [Rhizophagus irregularis]